MSEREAPKQDIDQIIDKILINKTGIFWKLNVKSEYYVDWGDDSLVVNYGNRAYKFYGSGYGRVEVQADKIRFYKDVTNDAKRLAEVNQFLFEPKSGESYQLSINSFDEIVHSKKLNNLVGIMPFVEGPNLEQAFLVSGSLREFLRETSGKICEELGVAGIEISPFNAKLRGNQIVVTDLCPNIRNLRHFGKRKFK